MPMPDLEDIPEQHEKKSQPPILRRRKNAHSLLQRIDISDSGNQSDYIVTNQQVQTGNITPSTPIKQLPFSPSQFLNSLSPSETWPRASTPKGSSPGPLTTPQPTGFRRSQNGTSPIEFPCACHYEFRTNRKFANLLFFIALEIFTKIDNAYVENILNK